MSPRVAALVRRYAVPVVILVALSGGGLAMCGLPGDSLDEGDDGEGIAGTYIVNGVDPSESEYSGTVTITPDGNRYAVQWLVTGAIQVGTGTLSGDRFVVEWRATQPGRDGEFATGTAEYVVADDGSLRGERFIDGVAERGTEEIFPDP